MMYLVGAVLSTIASPIQAKDKDQPSAPTQVKYDRLIGGWVNLSNGDTIEFRPDGDVFDDGLGRGRASNCDALGANLCMHWDRIDCDYRVVFTVDKTMLLTLRNEKPSPKCPSGSFKRIEK
jgi:hypothetical protein